MSASATSLPGQMATTANWSCIFQCVLRELPVFPVETGGLAFSLQIQTRWSSGSSGRLEEPRACTRRALRKSSWRRAVLDAACPNREAALIWNADHRGPIDGRVILCRGSKARRDDSSEISGSCPALPGPSRNRRGHSRAPRRDNWLSTSRGSRDGVQNFSHFWSAACSS